MYDASREIESRRHVSESACLNYCINAKREEKKKFSNWASKVRVISNSVARGSELVSQQLIFLIIRTIQLFKQCDRLIFWDRVSRFPAIKIFNKSSLSGYHYTWWWIRRRDEIASLVVSRQMCSFYAIHIFASTVNGIAIWNRYPSLDRTWSFSFWALVRHFQLPTNH